MADDQNTFQTTDNQGFILPDEGVVFPQGVGGGAGQAANAQNQGAVGQGAITNQSTGQNDDAQVPVDETSTTSSTSGQSSFQAPEEDFGEGPASMFDEEDEESILDDATLDRLEEGVKQQEAQKQLSNDSESDEDGTDDEWDEAFEDEAFEDEADQDQSEGEEKALVVPPEVAEKFSEWIVLIRESQSMNAEERQYWVDVLPIMSQDQLDNLRSILDNEKKQLAEAEEKYQNKIRQAGDVATKAFDEAAYQEKKRVRLEAEQQHEAEERAKEEAILAEIGAL